MKKNILVLEQYAAISGGQRILLGIIEGLTADFHFKVLLPEPGDLSAELRRLGADYSIMPFGYYGIGRKSASDVLRYLARSPLLILRMVRLLRLDRPALVYANGARTFVWATIACALTGVPLVWHVHSIFSSGIAKSVLLFFGRARCVRRVIAVSQAAAAPLAALGGKLLILRNAIDTATFFPEQARSHALRDGIGAHDKVLVGMVGLLLPWKGVDDFIRAASIVRGRDPGVHFVIVGDVLHARDEGYRRSLEELARQNGLEHSLSFTGYRSDIPRVMRDLDVYVLASKQPDPCPTSLLQAMGSGVAVVAPDSGGPAEIVEHGVTGLLFKTGSVRELAEAVLSLTGDAPRRAAVGSRAASTISKQYCMADYRAQLRKILGSAIAADDSYEACNPGWHIEDSPWKARKIIELIGRDLPGSLASPVRIVDIGCGAGVILGHVADHFKARGLEVIAEGFDTAEFPLGKARRSCPAAQFHCAPFDKSLYAGTGNRATLTLLIDILEHLEQPDRLLLDAGDVSDYVVCHLPLENNLMVNTRGMRGKFRRTVGHLHFFDEAGARALFARLGFTVVKSSYTCLDYDADYRLKSPLRRIFLQPLRRLLFRRFPRFTAQVLGNVSLLVLLKKSP